MKYREEIINKDHNLKKIKKLVKNNYKKKNKNYKK